MSSSLGGDEPLDALAKAAAWEADRCSDAESDRHASLEACDASDLHAFTLQPATCRIARREKTRGYAIKSKEQRDRKRLLQRAAKDELKQDAATGSDGGSDGRAVLPSVGGAAAAIVAAAGADQVLDATDAVKKRLSTSRRNKLRDKSRSFERDLKSYGDGSDSQAAAAADGGQGQHTSSGSAHGARRRASAHGSTAWHHVNKPKGQPRLGSCRQPSINRQDCQPDRLEFYKNFSLLINLGSKGLKEREEKFKRQKSEEEELLRSRLHDDIWLELQAWHAGRPARDYELILGLQRERARSVLDEVKRFCLGGNGGGSSDEMASLMQLLHDPLHLSDAYVARLYAALRKVLEQTERVHAVLALFPTAHAMRRYYGPQSAGPDFLLRVEAMQMWLNSATELCTIITGSMKSCGLDKVPVHYPFLSGWNSTGISLSTSSAGQLGAAAAAAAAADGPATAGSSGGSSAAPSVGGLPVPVVAWASDDSDGPGSGGGRKSVHFDVNTPPCSPQSDDESHPLAPQPDSPATAADGSGYGSSGGGDGSSGTTFDAAAAAGVGSYSSSSSAGRRGMTVATSYGVVPIPSSHTGVYRPFIDTMLRKMSLGALFKKYTKHFFSTSVKAFHSIALLESCPTEPLHKASSRRLSPAGDVVASLPLLPPLVARQLSAISASEREWSQVARQGSGNGVSSDGIGIVVGGSTSELPPPLAVDAAAAAMAAAATAMAAATAAGDSSESRALPGLQAVPGCCYYEQYLSLRLVSLKPAYVFLLRMPLDLTHECVRLRLEQRVEPSLLSVKQVTQECQEIITLAVQVKLMYHLFVAPVLTVLHEAEEKLECCMDDYNVDVREMLGVYFSYLQHWMLELQKQRQATSASMKSILEEGWAYSKQVCPYIRGGVVEAGKRFCGMASNLLTSIRNSLDNDVDDTVNEYSDSLFRSNSKTRYPTSDSTSLSSSPSEAEDVCTDVDYKHYLLQTCRSIKNLFRETRERAAKALGFAKMLRKDLEIAADFNVLGAPEKLLADLAISNHVMVTVPQKPGYLLFVPNSIAGTPERILALLNVMCGREDTASDVASLDADTARVISQTVEESSRLGYLVLLPWDPSKPRQQQLIGASWRGPTVHVTPSADTGIALSHIDVGGLLLVVDRSSELAARRREFESCVPDRVELVDEQTSCHQAVAEALEELKCTALDLSDAIYTTVSLVLDKLFSLDLSSMEDCERSSILTICRETMHQCYNFGFDYLQELTRIVTSSAVTRRKLNKNLLRFASMWMQFVTEKCERGRGTRPRWATQGMDFLIVASDPKILMLLEPAEFEELKEQINRCVSHIIGDKSFATAIVSAGGLGRSVSTNSGGLSAESATQRPRQLTKRNISCPSDPVRSPHSRRPTHSEPGTPGSSKGSRDSATSGLARLAIDETAASDEFLLGSPSDGSIRDAASPGATEDHTPVSRVRKAVRSLELKRNAKLYDKRFIGRVAERSHDVDYHNHISVRRVNFKWQRGNKLGEGQYGKVYSAVNVDTGELMAMKELRFQPNDLQTIKEIADELKIFESIHHSSLVKYYGVEVHRDEMFIFMEYCDCGTLEEAAKGGLTEGMIRQYTRKLLVAVSVLHDHNIVHRDIKGANIFLLSNGLLKLGDFGCSVQLKDKATMPGEINNVIGTAAFMAPEVITRRHEGHGRAADIWSLGCVVVEMATGKRPWPDLENSYQIMFKVGMGGVPTIPDSLSSEGRDFLSHCFTQDPKLRWTASQLQRHNFTKVDSDC